MYLASAKIYKYVVQVSVSKPDDVAYNGHDCQRGGVQSGALPPATSVDTVAPQLPVQTIIYSTSTSCLRL